MNAVLQPVSKVKERTVVVAQQKDQKAVLSSPNDMVVLRGAVYVFIL